MAVKLSEFDSLMRAHFGSVRAASISHDHVFAGLNGRTIDEAIEAGIEPKRIWALVGEAFDVPEPLRHGLPD